MKYMLIHTVEESRLQNLPPRIEDDLRVWADEMVGRGVELDGARLHSVSDATTVRRAADGSAVVTDGPFAETKEQVAGYDVIECPDLDAAIAVAAAHPTTQVGAIEVRPFEGAGPDPQVPDAVPDDRRRYMMLVCAAMSGSPDSADTSTPGEDAEDEAVIERWIADAGDRRLYGWQLQHPSQAVTVRRLDGRVMTTDGPFAETKEQIAGFDVLECTDLDEAIQIAAGHPVADGGVLDIRPLAV
jgi:hypothetical protein